MERWVHQHNGFSWALGKNENKNHHVKKKNKEHPEETNKLMLLKHPFLLEYLDIIETIKSNVDFKSNCIPLISTMKMNSFHLKG